MTWNAFLGRLGPGKRSRVGRVGRGKARETIDTFFRDRLSAFQEARIRWACCDMSETFIGAIRQHCPNAQLVLDRFHVVKALNEAVDRCARSSGGKPAARIASCSRVCVGCCCITPPSARERTGARSKPWRRPTRRIYRAWGAEGRAGDAAGQGDGPRLVGRGHDRDVPELIAAVDSLGFGYLAVGRLQGDVPQRAVTGFDRLAEGEAGMGGRPVAIEAFARSGQVETARLPSFPWYGKFSRNHVKHSLETVTVDGKTRL